MRRFNLPDLAAPERNLASVKTLLRVLIGLVICGASAQAGNEQFELSPEQRDAAFSAQDAAREAQAWSTQALERNTSDALSQLAADADLIFRGRVESQSFEYDSAGTPFTRTEFVLADVVKGERSAAQFTLLQEGGPSQSGDGRVLLVSNSRHFAVGEEELLFVELHPAEFRADRRAAVQHRFRIYQERLYTEDGQGVILSQAHERGQRRLELSADRHPAPRFSRIQIGEHTLTKRFQPEKPARRAAALASGEHKKPRRSYRDSVDVATFARALQPGRDE